MIFFVVEMDFLKGGYVNIISFIADARYPGCIMLRLKWLRVCGRLCCETGRLAVSNGPFGNAVWAMSVGGMALCNVFSVIGHLPLWVISGLNECGGRPKVICQRAP